ncbi:enoyl-CoA hydratase-related protein [Rhodococcus sp. IEGM 1307]|jgi:enoyl-CoA hydratase/carnithine racemase|uniref:enoyl-CoA hydratase-related protein n=1 Tax=Rhodococcus sp. IEGM 1307 TaxID=3047091 RepID=UPI0010DE4286|nr:enoyl-CoA hydratase-related protein [Rhodococcus sp. IEGM 1307]MDI9977388.1 enoyl-CoA hydratase-related protein [Rhodococcus sp. IEGM 1307]
MTVMVDKVVAAESTGLVWLLTLDRPGKRNAFNEGLTAALDEALNAFEDDPIARVAVLTGGPAVFCAGTDVQRWAGEPTERGGPYGIAGRDLQKPVIAAVEGVAAGGGFEIALAATLIVASHEAAFSLPEVSLGLIAECGGLFRGPRALPLNLARELALTGRPLSAARAFEVGLVNRLVEPGETVQEALDLANAVLANAPLAVEESLRTLNDLYRHEDQAAWISTERAKQAVRQSADAKEGVAAFLERRPPQWSGS